MNKKMCKVLTLLLCTVLVFSCAGNKPKEKKYDPNFIGDYDPLRLENFIALTYSAAGGLKPLEANLYFVPRSNNVEMYFRSSINEIAWVLSPENRDTIRTGAEAYVTAYREENLSEIKPNEKNAFISGTTSLAWGVLAPVHTAEEVPFWINYSYLEAGKPYFMLHFTPARAKDDDSIFSPSVQVYFSPSQLSSFLDLLDQVYLESLVNELNTKAFTFE